MSEFEINGRLDMPLTTDQETFLPIVSVMSCTNMLLPELVRTDFEPTTH